MLPLAAVLAGVGCRAQNLQSPAFASAPELRDCEGQALSAYDGADKVEVIVRVKDKTPRSYSTTALCVRIDDKLVAPQPKTATIEQLRGTIAFVALVPPGDHKVKVDVTAAGIAGSDIEGQRFDASTDKDVSTRNKELLDLVLTAAGPKDKPLVFKWDEHAYKGDAPTP